MHWLSLHPRLHAGSGQDKAHQREVHYFTRHIGAYRAEAGFTPDPNNDQHQSQVLRYLEYFPSFSVSEVKRPHRPLVFEKSPDYIRSPSAITAIRSLLPGIKLVAILRDPVRRAFSEVVHHCRHRRYVKITSNEMLGAQYEQSSIINTFYIQGLDLRTVPPSHYSLLSPADCDAVMVEKYFTSSTRDRGVVPEVRNGFYDEQLSVLIQR